MKKLSINFDGYPQAIDDNLDRGLPHLPAMHWPIQDGPMAQCYGGSLILTPVDWQIVQTVNFFRSRGVNASSFLSDPWARSQSMTNSHLNIAMPKLIVDLATKITP